LAAAAVTELALVVWFRWVAMEPAEGMPVMLPSQIQVPSTRSVMLLKESLPRVSVAVVATVLVPVVPYPLAAMEILVAPQVGYLSATAETLLPTVRMRRVFLLRVSAAVADQAVDRVVQYLWAATLQQLAMAILFP
jgi:hypothetical protein